MHQGLHGHSITVAAQLKLTPEAARATRWNFTRSTHTPCCMEDHTDDQHECGVVHEALFKDALSQAFHSLRHHESLLYTTD
jgi:hypothetical protein